MATDSPAFLITGDLAFFYDMNALRLNCVKKNMHVLLINNHGGSEFYYNGTWVDKYSDLHTTARHNTQAAEWAKSNGFKYLTASNKAQFDDIIKDFMTEKDQPILFEVFTEMSTDAKYINDFYDLSRPKDMKSEAIRKSKSFIKKTIGQEKAQKIAKKFGIKK